MKILFSTEACFRKLFLLATRWFSDAKEVTGRFLSNGFQHVKNLSSNIRWWRIAGIVLLIFVVTTPGLLTFKSLPHISFPDSTSISWHYLYRPSITTTNTLAQKNMATKIEVPKGSLSSASIFTRLAGDESQSPPISICLDNDSKPIPPGMQISTSSISSELGAMSFKVRNTDTSEAVEIYAKVGNSTCNIFQSNQTEVLNANDLEWNNLYAVGNANGQSFDSAYINFGNTKVDISTTLTLKEYAFELLITLLGIGILIQIFAALRKFITRHPKG